MFSTVTALGITNGEPMLQYTPEGDPIFRFYLHVIRYYTYNGEEQNDYILLGVQVSGEEAERLNQEGIKPYQQVLVSGYLIGDEGGNPEIVFDNKGQGRSLYTIQATEVVPTTGFQTDEMERWLPGYCDLVAVGNLGQDPELRYTGSGAPVATLSIAVNRKSGNEDVTLWLRATVWNKTAENCAQYLKKGRQVLVHARFQTDRGENGADPLNPGGPRLWTNNQGELRASFELTASRVQFLGGGGGGRGSSGVPDPKALAGELESVF